MGRISEHPILGTTEKGKEVEFTFDGKTMKGYEDEPIATCVTPLKEGMDVRTQDGVEAVGV